MLLLAWRDLAELESCNGVLHLHGNSVIDRYRVISRFGALWWFWRSVNLSCFLRRLTDYFWKKWSDWRALLNHSVRPPWRVNLRTSLTPHCSCQSQSSDGRAWRERKHRRIGTDTEFCTSCSIYWWYWKRSRRLLGDLVGILVCKCMHCKTFCARLFQTKCKYRIMWNGSCVIWCPTPRKGVKVFFTRASAMGGIIQRK